jgi:hypothetical protein
MTKQEIIAVVEKQRLAQGLPPKVSDPAALRKIAGLVAAEGVSDGAR